MKKAKTTKNIWFFKKCIILIWIWFSVLSMTQALTIPDGLTLIRANIWNAVQYIKQTIFTSSGINSWTKLMDINANSGYVWINHQLLNTWISFNWKFLSLNQNGYLIYSDVPFSSGAQSSGDIYVNGISFDSWTNILTLHMHWGWMVTWSLEGILPTWVLWDTPYRDWNKWITNNPYIFNLWTGAVWIGPNRSDSNRPHVCEREWYEGLDIDWQLRIRNIPYVIRNWSEILVLEKEADENLCNGDSQWTVRKLDRKKIEERLTRITSLENTKKCANWQILQYSVSTKVWWTNERVCVDPCCLEGIKYNPDTNQLTLSTQNNQTFTETIDTWRRLGEEKKHIYNYNDWQKVLIWNNTWVEPLTQLEIRNDNWFNLMLTNYTTTTQQNKFVGFWFWVPDLRAAISFQNRNNDPYGRGELRFALNNDENRQNFNEFEDIMIIKHVWNTWAVWINAKPNIKWVALEINDTMRLEPRTSEPFECNETTAWSMFMYIKTNDKTNETRYVYPCFCGSLEVNNGDPTYEWLAMWRGNTVSCFNENFIKTEK